jgi:hypothetical protein
MTLFKKNHFWRYNLHFMDHIPILIVLFWNIGMGHNLLFPYFGGITIHWPAILVYYPGTRVLSHRCHLVGGLAHVLFSIINIWDNPSHLTNVFQRGWNHQPVHDLEIWWGNPWDPWGWHKNVMKHLLVGGLEHLDYFSTQLGLSSSQLTSIFFRGLETTNQPFII